MTIGSALTSRSCLAVCVLLGQAAWVTPAFAQFEYGAQSRTVSVEAHSYYSAITGPAPGPLQPPATTTVWDDAGDSVSSDSLDFGPFNPTVSATAISSGLSTTVSASFQSSLVADGVGLSMNHTMAHVGSSPLVIYTQTIRDRVSFLSTVQFSLIDTTTVALTRDLSLSGDGVGTQWNIQLDGLDTGIVNDLSNSSQQTLTLAPGAYRLTANLSISRPVASGSYQSSGASVFNMIAVPEVSTWVMMCLGLASVGALVRRRRTH